MRMNFEYVYFENSMIWTDNQRNEAKEAKRAKQNDTQWRRRVRHLDLTER